MKRLEARGKGILLLHDIHPATVAALPGLLKELKQRGFHIVHVMPISVDQLWPRTLIANVVARSLVRLRHYASARLHVGLATVRALLCGTPSTFKKGSDHLASPVGGLRRQHNIPQGLFVGLLPWIS